MCFIELLSEYIESLLLNRITKYLIPQMHFRGMNSDIDFKVETHMIEGREIWEPSAIVKSSLCLALGERIVIEGSCALVWADGG